MKKKGFFLSMEFLTSLILVILFLAFGSFLIVKIYGSNLKSQANDVVCWESVYSNSAKRTPGTSVETVNIKCPTKYISFHENHYEEEFEQTEYLDIEQDSVKYKSTEKKECNSEDYDDEEQQACIFYNVNKKIAEEMKRCWFNFHEGKLRVFSQYESKTQCVVCTNILFDEQIRDKYSKLGYLGQYMPEDPNYNLELYMKMNQAYFGANIKTKEVLEKNKAQYSIYDYTLDLLDKNWELPIYDYEVSEDYAIVFSALNEHYFDNVAGDIWAAIKNKITHEPVENEPNYINTLHFVPNSQVAEYCGTWA